VAAKSLSARLSKFRLAWKIGDFRRVVDAILGEPEDPSAQATRRNVTSGCNAPMSVPFLACWGPPLERPVIGAVRIEGPAELACGSLTAEEWLGSSHCPQQWPRWP